MMVLLYLIINTSRLYDLLYDLLFVFFLLLLLKCLVWLESVLNHFFELVWLFWMCILFPTCSRSRRQSLALSFNSDYLFIGPWSFKLWLNGEFSVYSQYAVTQTWLVQLVYEHQLKHISHFLHFGRIFLVVIVPVVECVAFFPTILKNTFCPFVLHGFHIYCCDVKVKDLLFRSI